MMKMRQHCLVGAFILSISATGPAYALPRVWVSSLGADVGGCGAASNPCRTFQFAAGRTDPKGEIDVRDPGDYGPVVISKPISIVNHAGGTVAIDGATTAITIGAGADNVYLQGLTINRSARGISRIATANVFVVDSVFRNCGSGVRTERTAYGAVTIKDSIFQKNSYGLRIEAGDVAVFDSIFEDNFVAVSGGTLSLYFGSTFSRNYYAFFGAYRLHLGNNTFSFNTANFRWTDRFSDPEINSFMDNHSVERWGYIEQPRTKM